MKKPSLLSLIVALSLGVAVTDSGFAQTAPTANAPATTTAAPDKVRITKVNKRVELLKTELNLTPDQESKVRDLIQANVSAAKAHREANPTATLKEHRKVLAENRAKLNQDIRALLTPEQQTKFDALEAQRKNRKAMKQEKEHAAPSAPATAPAPVH
ncbi:MAG TPA: hypothetical protein VIT91_09070 [Chthoniobacterales bacterium]